MSKSARAVASKPPTASVINAGTLAPDKDVEAKVLIERWRQEYNRVRPHSAPGYRPPAPLEGVVEGVSEVVQLPRAGHKEAQ